MKSTIVFSILFSTYCLRAQQVFFPKEIVIGELAVATIQLKGYPDFLVADNDGVWVTNEGRIEKLQHGKNIPVLSVEMPQPCGIMAVGFGSLWVVSCGRKAVYRIDLKSGSIQSVIDTGIADPDGELSLAVGAGSVWLLTNRVGELSRIDPANNKVAGRIIVEPNSFVVAFGYGALWITNTQNSSVQRIDPKTEKIVATIKVGKGPRFLTSGLGAIWTLNQDDGTVSKIDPSTNKVSTIEAAAIGTGGDITAGQKYLYIRAKNILLSVIDPQTNKVISRFGPPAGSGAVCVENGRVWVTAHDVNTIWILKE